MKGKYLIGSAVLLLFGAGLKAFSQETSAYKPVEVPIEIRRGRVMVPAGLNDGRNVSLLLDTGFGLTTIHPNLAESLQLQRRGSIRILGIAGEEQAPMYEGLVFKLGATNYTPRRVAAIPSERERKRDGILGSGFFRRFVVEIDHAGKRLLLHPPDHFKYSGSGEIIPMTFRKDTPIVPGEITFPGKGPLKAEFEIDSGCDGGLCLGHDFLTEHGVTSEEGRAGQRQGIGGGASTRTGKVTELKLGKIRIVDPQADFFQSGSPVDKPLAGHIGAQVLRAYKVILDYKRKQLIIESPKTP